VSNLDSNLLIDTPENLVLEAEIAGFGSRFMAALIDYIIIYVVLITFGCLFARSITFETDNKEWGIALFFLIQFVVFFFYHLIFEFILNGQTPGKRQIGLRVVQSNGMPLTVTGLLIRNFVRLVDFLPIFYGVGLLSLFVTKNTQRLGDLAARTLVIREQKQLTVRSLQEDYSVRYFHISQAETPPNYIDLTNLTQQDRYTIINYLQRRWELSNRELIVGPLAQRIIRAMDVDQMPPIRSPRAAETLLEQVARAFELADRGEWPPQITVADSVFEEPPPERPAHAEPVSESGPAVPPVATTSSDDSDSTFLLDTQPDDPPPMDEESPDAPPSDAPDTSWQRFRLD
jgi:uncharacterized RDD family membrane protein YckC